MLLVLSIFWIVDVVVLVRVEVVFVIAVLTTVEEIVLEVVLWGVYIPHMSDLSAILQIMGSGAFCEVGVKKL